MSGHAGPRSPLASARVFTIPRWLLKATVKVLRSAGETGHEAFVVWGGTVQSDGTEIVFESGLVPAQEGHVTADGLLVTVSGESLFDVNRELYGRGQVLAAQVHSHPTDAYHSDTDDCFSLVTLTGALSVVVPAFGRGGDGDLSGWAWYRLTGEGQWSELTRRDPASAPTRRSTAGPACRIPADDPPPSRKDRRLHLRRPGLPTRLDRPRHRPRSSEARRRRMT